MEGIEYIEINKNDNSILKTNIKGFDDLFQEGGLPKNISILVSGSTGTGKSIFCRQICYNMLKNNRRCLYISFQESEKSIIRSMEKFNWDLYQFIDNGTFIIQKINPMDILRMKFGSVGGSGSATEISYKIKPFDIPTNFNPDIIVIDSLSSIIDISTTKEKNFRLYLQQLFSFLEETNSVSLLISESPLSNLKYSNYGIEEFLSDGVISFYKSNNKFKRAISINKMRFSSHRMNIYKMSINKNGIEIFPDQIVERL
jgi:circadian clock protein KaiC